MDLADANCVQAADDANHFSTLWGRSEEACSCYRQPIAVTSPNQGGDVLAGCKAPDPNRPVPAGREQSIAIGRKRHGRYLSGVLCERADQRPCGGVPQFDRVVITAREYACTIRREYH